MTGGTIVRPGAESDLPVLTGIYNHFVEHTVATFDVEPFSVDARGDWFAHYDATGPHRLLVAEVDGTPVSMGTSSSTRPTTAIKSGTFR